MSGSPRRTAWRLGLLCSLAIAACSGKDSSSTTPSSATASLPEGTAVGTVTLTGDPQATGAAINVSVRCGFPSLKGISLAVLGKAYDATTDMRLSVRADTVSVQLSSGSGADYHERAFVGTGVSGFDAAKGAQIDSPLSEAPATTGTTPGAVPAITAIKGSIDCHDQKPGTSTLTLTGDTPEGRLDAATLDSARVECNTDAVGNEVSVVGLVTIGSAKAFLSIGLRVDGVGVSEVLDSGTVHQYQAPAGSAVPTPTGGHASGDAVEQNATPPHTIHVEGDVTCGSPA